MTPVVAPFVGEAAEWDRFAGPCPGFTHFHRLAWLRVIAVVHGHDVLPLAARDADGALCGILPLVRVKSAVFGHYLVSMPFVNYGGPLGTDAAVRALAAEAAARARRDGAKLLELRSRAPLPLDLPVSHRKITVVLDVPGDPDTLFATFKAKLRSQVRRPQKEGVTIRFGADQLDPFYAVFSRHMRDLGTPAQSRALFAALLETFRDDVWVACAWLRETPVACGWGFRWGGEVEMTWASSLQAFSGISPNMGLYWAFMERAAREGVTRFNFGRCTPGSGTHRFKQQWGGRDEPLHWYQWTPEGAAAATPSPDDAAFAWGPRLWKRLPLPVATWLGPRIVRGIP